MEEMDPDLALWHYDALSHEAFMQRHEELTELIHEALEAYQAGSLHIDEYRLGIYSDAMDDLLSTNRNHAKKLTSGVQSQDEKDPCIFKSNGLEPLSPQRLSPQEARTVELSLNPVRRLGQLAHYGSAFHMRKADWSPLPLYMTRGDLVREAESRQYAEQVIEITSRTAQHDDA